MWLKRTVSSSESFFDEAEETFRQLANSHRPQIIFFLHKQTGKMSTLSRILKMSMQDAKRNLDNLLSEGLVERDSKGVFSLTTFGSMIVRQIPSMDFLSRNKEYFSDHNFGEIPDKFIHRMASLMTVNLSRDMSQLSRRLKGCMQKQKNIFMECYLKYH
jgi:predicted transcriptional regulator